MKQEIIDFRNSQFDNADLNYAKIFENYDTLKIERFDPTNPEHQNITDEDCNIYIKDDGWEGWYKETFRKVDRDDIYIPLASYKGNELSKSKMIEKGVADGWFYFTPSNIYRIDYEAVKQFASRFFNSDYSTIKEFASSYKKTTYIDKYMTLASSKSGEHKNIGLCVSIEFLEKMRVMGLTYPRIYEEERLDLIKKDNSQTPKEEIMNAKEFMNWVKEMKKKRPLYW